MIGLLIKLAAYVGLLFILAQAFKDFKVKPGSFIVVALVLWLVGWGVSWTIGILAIPFKWIFGFLITWLLNVLVIHITDKLMDSFDIGSKQTLFISGAALSIANWAVDRFVQ